LRRERVAIPAALGWIIPRRTQKGGGGRPRQNGICERFHRTIPDEFYQVAFRKKLSASLENLQVDLDEWLLEYNRERPHSGKHCNGRTPFQTFRETRHLAFQKMLERQFNAEEHEDQTT